MSPRWGLIGFGEAGRVIGGVLTAAGADLVVHDPAVFDPVRGQAVAAAAAGIGARVAADVADLRDCAVVLSLVTPATAVEAAAGFAPHAGDGVLYLDLNSTAPQDKHDVLARLPGARVVDGVMTGGGIRLDAGRIPISLAGPDAPEAAELLSGMGLNAAVVGSEVGAAAALKMLRGVIIKGMEGLWVEALLAAEHLGVVEPLFDMVTETLDRLPARDFASMLVTTHVAHAGRRQVEARMVRDTVEAAGVEPLMSAASVARQERTARGLGAIGRAAGDVPGSLDAALAVLRALPAERRHDDPRPPGGLTGVLPITLTPFTDDGDVDEASIDSLVEDYLGAGAHGLTILGIMGEAARLLDVERDAVLRRYLRAVAGRVPVVVGVSARATRMSLDYARRAEDAGAAAVMLAAPEGTKNLDLVFEHFRRVAESVAVPVVVQDEPVNTGVTMPAPFLVRLLEQIEGCRYLKLEETPTLPKISVVRESVTRPVGVFGGLGGLYFYEELLRGADGIMTGFGFPRVLVRTYELFLAGDRSAAQSHFFRHLPLIRYEAQLGVGGVSIRKQVFARRGAISSPHARAPVPPVDERTLAELDDLIERTNRCD